MSEHNLQQNKTQYQVLQDVPVRFAYAWLLHGLWRVKASTVSCSVDLPSYVAGSWLGMLPGTIAYVYAGNYGRALIDGDGDVGGVKGWQVALGLGITVLAVGYIGKLAKKALDDVEQDEGTSSSRP